MKILLTIIFCLAGVSAFCQQQTDTLILRSPHSKVPDSLRNLPLRPLAPNAYTAKFGFFCKKELQLEKAVKIPIRIRLGSLDEVNRLEGKTN